VKRIVFSRKAILRAIHAACVALYLLAAQREVSAQSYTPPFVVNGSAVSTNASGTFTSPVGFYDNVNFYSSITVGSGVTINSSSTYGGPIIGGAFTAVIGATTSSFVNHGSLNLNTTSGNYLDTVGLNQGATSVAATNSGSIINTGLSGVLNVGSALYIVSSSGNATVDNSGTIASTGGNSQYALWMQSNSGNIGLTNEQTGQISDDTGFAVYAQASGSGAVTITNNGTLTAFSTVIDAQSSTGAVQITNNGNVNLTGNQDGIFGDSDGGVTVNNTGHIVANSGSGIYLEGVSTNAGALTVTNTGSISAGSFGVGVQQPGSGNISITNSGAITASYSAIYAYFDGPSTASALYIRNTGTITSTGSGIYTYSPTTLYDSGNITAATQAISVPSGSIVTLAGRPIISGPIVGGSSSSSTSQLIFNLTIPSANLAAAQAQLNTELAAYAAQNGGTYTFTVDGLTYDVSNFAYNDITDDLTLPPVTRHYADTPGYNSMGTVLDNLSTSNAQASTILNALNNVPDANVAAALSELSPQQLQVFRNVAFDNNTFNVAKINNHLANRRDGATGFDSSQLSVHDPSMDGTLDQIRSHLLAYNNPASSLGPVSDSGQAMFGAVDTKDAKDTQTVALATGPSDPWSTFISGDVLLANLSNSATQQHSNYTTGSVTAGADYRLDDHFTVGALLGYAHTDANLDSRGSSATVDSYTAGLYASYVNQGWYANFLGAYSRNAYTSDRIVDIPGLAGDNHGGTHGNQGSVNLTGGYEFQKGAFKFGPIASVQYVHLAVDSEQENGPTALSINSQTQDSLRSQLGFEGRFVAEVHTPLGPMILTPHLSASWQHEYMDSSGGITSQFTGTGGGSFLTQTQPPDRDAAFLDAGLDATLDTNVTIFVDYETQAGQENYFAQSAEGGVKIGF
jgi:outer membrane lipase/esterase